jgi:hypothetical protein
MADGDGRRTGVAAVVATFEKSACDWRDKPKSEITGSIVVASPARACACIRACACASARFIPPSARVMSTLSSLMSPWMIPTSCKYAIPCESINTDVVL